jgi:hypothetical protein
MIHLKIEGNSTLVGQHVQIVIIFYCQEYRGLFQKKIYWSYVHTQVERKSTIPTLKVLVTINKHALMIEPFSYYFILLEKKLE